MMRKMVRMCAVCGLVFVAVVLVGGLADGLSVREVAGVMKSAVEARVNRKTVADRVQEIETKRPGLVAVAHEMRGDLTVLVFKRERMVELWASGWREPRMYAMTGFSGRLGPKLKEGDGQIPEGVYAVEYLNPNSRFHLSLKVSYPNGFDRARARADGRAELGGDIMIHGGEATVGCIPIGDEGIEEVFYLVEKAGGSHVKIVIAPYDMRSGRERSLEKKVGIPWYAALCDGIEKALQKVRAGGAHTTDGTDARRRYILMTPLHLCRSVSGEARIRDICGKDGGERTPGRRVMDGGRVATCCDRAVAARGYGEDGIIRA